MSPPARARLASASSPPSTMERCVVPPSPHLWRGTDIDVDALAPPRQLDPIPATRGRTKAATASTAATALTSLIPAPRRFPSSGASSPATTPTASEYAGGGARGSKWEREWEREREQEAVVGAGRRALPAPEVSNARVWWAWVGAVGELLGYGRGRGQGQGQGQRGRGRAMGRGRRAAMAVRAMKSCALVAKVRPSVSSATFLLSALSRGFLFYVSLGSARILTRTCIFCARQVASLTYVRPDAAAGGNAHLAVVVGLLLALGVADTLFEGVDVSVALGLVHLLVLWACGASWAPGRGLGLGSDAGAGLLKSVVWGRVEEAAAAVLT